MPNNTIDWGQGSANNDIGWGKGPINNDLSWGMIGEDSYGHDETNLMGGGTSFIGTFGQPAIGLSLRDLTDTDPNVLRVRRDSDDAEADFKASEVSDGTLLNWVNDSVIHYQSDYANNKNDISDTNVTTTINQTALGITGALEIENTSTGSCYPQIRNLIPDDQTVRIQGDYYIPTGQDCDRLIFRGNSEYFRAETTGAWASFDQTITTDRDDLFIFMSDGGSLSLSSTGNLFYLKNVVITQETANGLVRTWYGQGNGVNAEQATASFQPSIVTNGILQTENGLAALAFDGTDDFLTIGGTINTDIISTSFVFKAETGQDAVLFQLIKDVSNFLAFGLGNIGTSNAYGTRYRALGSDYTTGGTGVTGQRLAMHYGEKTTPSIELYLDNTLQTGTESSRAAATDGTAIGARGTSGSNANCKIQELVAYLSDKQGERTLMEANINDYYTIY